MASLLWVPILTTHLLTLIYWIGSSMTCLQLRGTTRLLEPVQATNMQLQYYTCFMHTLLRVIPLCFIAGAALIWHNGKYPYLPWPYHLMMSCAVIMAGIFLFMFLGPFRAARRAIRPQQELFITLNRCTLLMTILGIIAVTGAGIALGHSHS